MTPDDLLVLADKVVGEAGSGEEIEAVVAWSHDTEIRAYDAEIESFTSSDSAGIGVRVVRDGRQGMAWSALLDEDAVRDCLESARDNASFGEPDAQAIGVGYRVADQEEGVPVQTSIRGNSRQIEALCFR